MSSMSSVIKQHNYRVLSITENVDRLCNCRNKENCPLDGKCLQSCIFCKVDVITKKDSHIYYGASDGEFKSRYNNHTSSFHHRHHEQDTELSKHIWNLEDKGINFKVKWSVTAYASTYRCGLRRCDLCSNGILSEMCVRYLTYCKPDECVNMKLIVAYLC